jgi:hypothetical protein
MKVLTTITLGLFLLGVCTVKADRQTKYSDFTNDLERDNLFGKVKEITQFKSNYIDAVSNKKETPIIEYKSEYTTFGKLSKFDVYIDFNKSRIGKSFEYNDKNQLIKTKFERGPQTLFFFLSKKTITTFEDDSFGNTILSMNIRGNSEITHMRYDSLRNLTKSVCIIKQDTFTNEISNTYNKEGKILTKRQIQISQKDTSIYLYDFKYNSSNKLISSNSSGKRIGEMSTNHDYCNELLIKTTKYQNGELIKETIYDNFYNPISEKEFRNNLLVSEFRNTYIFDSEGNWNVKIVEIKDGDSSSTKFKLLREETREIEYY